MTQPVLPPYTCDSCGSENDLGPVWMASGGIAIERVCTPCFEMWEEAEDRFEIRARMGYWKRGQA